MYIVTIEVFNQEQIIYQIQLLLLAITLQGTKLK